MCHTIPEPPTPLRQIAADIDIGVIFSTINNLTNITLDTAFSAICGITEEELSTVLKDDIARLADNNDMSYEEMHQKRLRDEGQRYCPPGS